MSSHPYSPPTAQLPNYTPNTLSAISLIAIFSAALAVVLVPATVLIRRHNPVLPTTSLLTAQWFLLCGSIHLVLEGYYALNTLAIPSQSTVLAQLWKEYSLSDSRYLLRDGFMTTMEAVTAFAWGPLSFVIAYCIATDRHALRHPLQLLVSVGQLYGDVLYYGIATFDRLVWGRDYCRPERYYFWGYFVLLNAFWIVIPAFMIRNSFVAIGDAFTRGSVGVKKLQ